MMTDKTCTRPKTATHPLVGLAGLAALGLVLQPVIEDPILSAAMKTIIVVMVPALVMIFLEIFVFKTHRRDSTQIEWTARNYNIQRIATKLVGLATIIAVVGMLYYVFPAYRANALNPFWEALRLLAPYLCVGAVAYVVALDGVMKQPEDGYYTLGQIVLFRRKQANMALLPPLARSWLIKGFFIPAMFAFLANNMVYLPQKMGVEYWYTDGLTLFAVSLSIIYSIDLVYALIGYIFAFRAIDTHERSSDPSMTAWVAALICYPPFSKLLDQDFANYEGPLEWSHVLPSYEPLLISWGILILLLIAIYTWSTIAFGLRFSNMSHRGIITNGPYRFTKHPAYISKNLSWWMISVPFLAFDDPMQAFRHCAMLFGVNVLYFIRAWTEERHLSNDPLYRDYQAYIAKHGIFRWIKILPADKIGQTKLSPVVVIK